MQTINFTFRNELIQDNLSLSYCYQCATCSGGCPVALKTEGKYNPRKIIELSLLGLEDSLLKERDPNVWLCSTCQKCVEYCPQKVSLTEIFTSIKNKLARIGKAPASFYIQGKSIFDNGLAIPFSAPILRRRDQLNLPRIEIAPPNEIQTILKETKFSELLFSFSSTLEANPSTNSEEKTPDGE